jgi:hypothetical protein
MNYSVVDWREMNLSTEMDNEVGPSALRRPFLAGARDSLFGSVFLPGAIFRYRWDTETDARIREQYRAELAYKFDLFRTTHRLLLGRTEESRRQDIYREQTSNGNFKAIDDFTPFRRMATDTPLTPFQRNSAFQWEQGNYLIHQGSFWKGRIQSVSGIRYDRSDAYNQNYNAATGAPTTQTRRVSSEPPSKWSPQVGLSYRVVREVSIYALSSHGLAPNYFQSDGAGQPFDPTQARSKEIGLKLDLYEGRISGTIGVFAVKRTNATRTVWWAPAPARGNFDPNKPVAFRMRFNGGPDKRYNNGNRTYYWNEADKPQALREALAAASVPGTAYKTDREYVIEAFNYGPLLATEKPAHYWLYDGSSRNFDPVRDWGVAAPTAAGNSQNGYANNPGLDRGAAVPVDDESRGVDLQVVFSPTDHWQAILSYAYITRRITSGGRFVRYPNDLPVSPWFGKFVDGTSIWGGAGSFTTPLDSSSFNGDALNQGESLDDTPEHSASLWNRYEFSRGRLEGLGLALGVKWESEREWRNGASNDGTQRRQADQVSVLNETYPARYNVDMMVDYQTRIWDREWRAAINVYNLMDNQSLYGEVYAAPRSFRFSLSTRF